MKTFTVLLMMCALCIPALAADVDGKWNGTVNSPAGDPPVTFNFKAEGEKLTGSTTGFDGSEVKITDGKILDGGKNITFKVTFDFGGMPFVIDYKGAVTPTEIKITADAAGMPVELLLKKAPPETPVATPAAAPAPATR